jgi:8-oxo-dGTP pyrophosphatase MutT (NUDIX family)
MKLKIPFEDKTLWQGKYISTKLLDNWYEYVHDGTGKLVVVLCFRNPEQGVWEFLGRYEKCPPHKDGIALCALTGGIEEGEQYPLVAAMRELKEESGIIPFNSEVIVLGTLRPSKASDSTAYLFAVDLNDLEKKHKYVGKGDGTKGEEGSYCAWVSEQEAINSKDPLLISAIARLKLKHE